MAVIPCGHHCSELISKHMVRLLTGRPTTGWCTSGLHKNHEIQYLGPGEVLFFNFHAAKNEVMDLVARLARPSTPTGN